MRRDKDGGRSPATPKERPLTRHQSEARGARMFSAKGAFSRVAWGVAPGNWIAG
jgi:hypothetical protein